MVNLKRPRIRRTSVVIDLPTKHLTISRDLQRARSIRIPLADLGPPTPLDRRRRERHSNPHPPGHTHIGLCPEGAD